ncbi:hypothetical protein BS47DRAFT_1384656 [Hydnum rufescens UP504]|uniref:Uncharacterized protein n=1 Tax=Hydnum rufescens UP504 TaxID=1448309 RepID=A0A9P6AMV1_9AGAM|nr:hypothetical protein BS47DRAFT_1384656 [Hydnum rufescens UP504]
MPEAIQRWVTEHKRNDQAQTEQGMIEWMQPPFAHPMLMRIAKHGALILPEEGHRQGWAHVDQALFLYPQWMMRVTVMRWLLTRHLVSCCLTEAEVEAGLISIHPLLNVPQPATHSEDASPPFTTEHPCLKAQTLYRKKKSIDDTEFRVPTRHRIPLASHALRDLHLVWNSSKEKLKNGEASRKINCGRYDSMTMVMSESGDSGQQVAVGVMPRMKTYYWLVGTQILESSSLPRRKAHARSAHAFAMILKAYVTIQSSEVVKGFYGPLTLRPVLSPKLQGPPVIGSGVEFQLVTTPAQLVQTGLFWGRPLLARRTVARAVYWIETIGLPSGVRRTRTSRGQRSAASEGRLASSPPMTKPRSMTRLRNPLEQLLLSLL